MLTRIDVVSKNTHQFLSNFALFILKTNKRRQIRIAYDL